MTDMELELQAAIVKWRNAANTARTNEVTATNPLIKGRLQGVAKGLDMAADRVELILTKYSPQT
ncbi:MAG TPA: hypothetical protein VHD90_19790 [Phototrophicaceae bacterium]|nr:hypothetical protein [Phototrophicaceae bacterium]